MSTEKRMTNRLRRGLVCLLPVVCALLLLYDLMPVLVTALAADAYAASGEATEIQPVSFPDAEGLIDINAASMEVLDTLPGVGSAIAQAIIDEWESNGTYFYPEDLMDAKGIGEGKFSAVKNLITVGE